jgi:serine/threonine protein kinase
MADIIMTNHTFLKMNQQFSIPNLSDRLGLTSPEFKVMAIYQGGMGTCAQIQNSNGQNFAIKVIHKNLLQDEYALNRYIEEMKTWLTLSACNGVVEAICLTKINEIPCITSQWMDYGSLRPFMTQYNPKLFYENIDRIISTLDWAFTKYSIIHRDLKPENILLDDKGKAFIADWGLSRPISKQTEETNFQNAINKLSSRIDITDAGSFLGTILYASPEQILGLKGIDHRSDIYSLGCIMYEWETGTPPFIADTPQEIAFQHLHKRPEPLGRLFKNTNYHVEKIILKCLEKDPNRRYQTYSTLIEEFQSIATKHSEIKKFVITERYKVPLIGEDEFKEKLKGKKLNAIYSKEENCAVIDQSEIDPYLDEAQSLLSLGKYEQAKDILESFYSYDFFFKIPDSNFVQYICINLALALQNAGKFDDGIFVLQTIENASSLPAAYFLNLSLLYLCKKEYANAEKICRQGLKLFPDYNDLLGNMTIALSSQNKLTEAKETAKKRISISRNVHSLEELAGVLCRIAESQKNKEFPNAIKNYKTALICLEEAKQLNPNFETARLSISNILFKLRKYVESSDEAVEAYRINNTVNEVQLFYTARNMLWVSEFKGCIDFCDEWLQKLPNSIFLKRVRAEALVDGFVIDKYQDGVRIVKESSLEFFTNIIKDKKHRLPSDFKFLAKIHGWIGDEENINIAISLLDEGISLFPDYWAFDFEKAIIFQRFDYLEDALDAILEAKKKAPWREINYLVLSSIYKNMDDGIKANKYKQEGIKLKEEKNILYA